MNARFNTSENAVTVKITLTPGQTLNYSWSHREEEGFASGAVTWFFDGEWVYCDATWTGSDCDGRSGGSLELRCRLDRLAAHEGFNAGEMFPVWEDAPDSHHTHFDESAELAGY